MGSLRNKNVAKMDNPYVVQQENKAKSQERRKRGLIRRLTLYGVLMTLIVGISTFVIISQNSTLAEKQQKLNELNGEMADLNHKEKLLKEEIIKLNDDNYLAKLARSEYLLSKKGEVIFNIPKNKEDSD